MLQNMPYLLPVLRAIADRPDDGGYTRPVVSGLSIDAVDAVVDALSRAGYVHAALVTNPFGERPGQHWEPAGLTTKGRELFERLTTPA